MCHHYESVREPEWLRELEAAESEEDDPDEVAADERETPEPTVPPADD